MKPRTIVLGLGALAALGLAAVAWYWLHREEPDPPFAPSLERGPVVPVADYRFSRPYTHDNLTVYLVHGPETLDGKSFLTLQEALEQDKATVNETGSVNQLSIENLSTDEEVYVQSGDIVKGGKQDRTLPYDAVIGPNSGPVAINSFCVEQGRWSKRGEEKFTCFSSSSSNMKQVACAADCAEVSQSQVWQNVARTQERLSKKLGEAVKADASKTSLQLTLETPAVREAIAPYQKALVPALDGQDGVIGYVVVINGQVFSADVYASRSLFRKLWPKLLEGSAVEAFLEADATRTFDAISEATVIQHLLEAEGAGAHNEAVTERTYVLARKMGPLKLVESCDRTRNNLVLHRSFLGNPEGEGQR
jgi:hypothetical protein